MDPVPRRSAGWLPPLVVVGIVVAIAASGWIVGGATRRPPVRVADGVVVPLALGWAGVGTNAYDGGYSGVRITSGTASADVVVAEFPDARSLLEDYARGPLRRRTARPVLAPDVRDTRLDSGVRALVVLYTAVDRRTGHAVEGEITSFVAGGARGVVFDGWAPGGMYGFVREDVVEMAGRTRVTR